VNVRILEDRVIDQIAAGEVVERPASVVKELVENALDAGATRVVVALREGGRQTVRVEDDGHGMDRDDALTCIERHATSKIRQAEDLATIATLGFRGEALPSIAAVSRFVLTTRTHTAPTGTRIRIDGGRLTDVREAAAAPGTVVEAKGLFHAQPARRAFLRSTDTELAHCREAVVRLALARPDVAFVVRHEPTVLLDCAPADLASRAADVLGKLGELRRVDDARGPLRLTGVVAGAGVHRPEAGRAAYLYVNGRWVRDQVLRRAVVGAYRDLVPPGRHPVVVLSLHLDPATVDVNVHPTKAEVRFRDPAGVASFVSDSLRAVLHARVASSSPTARSAPGLPSLPFVPSEPVTAPVPVPTPVPVPASRPVADHPVFAAEPTDPVLITTLHERWLVLASEDSLQVVDGGRLSRRVQVAGLDGSTVRLLAPAVVRISQSDVLDDELLESLGLRLTRFSATEIVVRGVPSRLVDAPPVELVRLAAGAADPRAAWALGLPPARVRDGAALLREASALGLAPRPVAGTVSLPP
jgi:DNA mismatch repair protein MutL